MGDNLINCTLSTLTPEQLIKSIVASVSSCYGIRVEKVTLAQGCQTPIQCDSWQDLWQLILSCIGIGKDGKAVLRIAVTDVTNCTTVTDFPCDLSTASFQQVASSIIKVDTHGNNCLHILNINCPPL